MTDRIISERFLDAREEPDQDLTPIRDYEKVPLVSLQEAIAPIKSLLYDVDGMIEIARRNSRKPKDGLTPDESGAIHLYTMLWPKLHSSLFTLLNKNLRSKNREVLIPWFLFLKLFFTALYKLPSMKGVIYRGVRGNLSDQYEEDHFWWGISSCTQTIDSIMPFIDSEDNRTMFEVECLNGKDIRSHSYFTEQHEILLVPGSYFQVVNKSSATKGLNIIKLREQIPRFQTMVSPLDSSSTLTPIDKLRISPPMKLKGHSKWKQNGITIAGGFGQGNRLNQLSCPQGVFIDSDRTIYIADQGNNRIVQWKRGAKEGQIIAGINEKGDQLNYPRDMIINKSNNSLIISDRWNRRVVQYENEKQQILISDIDCCALSTDETGSIYVSDTEKHEVKRWKKGEKHGIVVAGGNKQGNHLKQLDFPTFFFVDKDYSIYVSDCYNHRVMKWKKNEKEGTIVAGGNDEGKSPKQLSYPEGIIVDHLGQIYVADCNNHRIMRWCEGNTVGELVVGANDQGKQSNQLNGPSGLSFDVEGNLYVVDCENHRIQKFEISSD